MGPKIANSLGAYTKALLKNAAITTLLFVVGFAIAGVPGWALTGFLCGILNLIPVFGSILALGLVLLIQFFASQDWIKLAMAAGVWLIVQVVDGFVLSPRAAGKAGVNPLLSIVLVLIAGLIFGPIGMILAVPVAAILLIVWRVSRSR